jgi:hypothetical protein
MTCAKFSFALLLSVAAGAGQMHAQSQARMPDALRAAAFDRLDRTSQTILWTVGCAQSMASARATGAFGPADSLGRTGQCFRQAGRPYGAFFTADSTFTKANRLRVLDLASHALYSGPVDTAAMLAEARAESDAEDRGFSAFQKERRPFAPISMRSDGDSIEVWLIPAVVFMRRVPSAVGGERGFVYSPDGRTLVREVDAFDRYRPLVIPDSGRVDIVSREEDLPLVSELIVTNDLNNSGREVRILTAEYSSQLVGRGATAVWIQQRRR